MCLSYLTKFDTTGIGYKVFSQDFDCKEPIYRNPFFSIGSIRKNQLCFTDNIIIVSTASCERYVAAFHIFEKKKDTHKYINFILKFKNSCCEWVVKKVRFKYVVTTGITIIENEDVQCLACEARTIVAREFSIID